MPFKSDKQRKWMYANDPEMAKKWEKEEAIRGKLRNVIKQEIKSVNEGFDKYHLGNVTDSKLSKRLQRAITVWGGKVDAVGQDYIKFRLSSSEVTKFPMLLKKLDQKKNVWIGDKRKKNIWDRRKNIDKLREGRILRAKQMVFLPGEKIYFDPMTTYFWTMGPHGGPDLDDDPIEPSEKYLYQKIIKKLKSKDKAIVKKAMRTRKRRKEATTSVGVPGYLSPKAFSKSTQNAIDIDDEDDEKKESMAAPFRRRKSRGLGRPMKESVNEAKEIKFHQIQPKDYIWYRGGIQYFVTKTGPNVLHMGLVNKGKPGSGGSLFASNTKLTRKNFDSQIRVKFIKKITRDKNTLWQESVNEGIKPQGYSQLTRAARTLPSDIKDFLKALKKQDDDAVEREILYLKAQFDTFDHILKDKKYTESINEGKEIYKVYFSDGNTIKITSDKGEDGAREFVKKIQGGRAGALSGAMHWTKNLKIKKIVKESVNEAKVSPEQAGKLFDKLLKKQTKGNLPSSKDIEIVFSLMRKKYGIKGESVNESLESDQKTGYLYMMKLRKKDKTAFWQITKSMGSDWGKLVKKAKKKGWMTESVNESDLGLTYKKGKTVKVTHKKSGKELIIIDKPNVRREYQKIGYFAEGTVNELPMAPFSSSEAKQHINQDIKKMSKHLGKASQQSIKIMMDGVKGGKYTAMDISRGIKEGPVGRTHFGELGFLQQLWNKVRDGFRRYSKDRKLS